MLEVPSTQFQNVLNPDEKLYWTGQPHQERGFNLVDLILMVFGLLWMGFWVFWEVVVFRVGAPWFFAAIGGVLMLLGVAIVVSRLFKPNTGSQTYYALTDQRIIMMVGPNGLMLITCPLSATAAVKLTRHKEGRGTLTFEVAPTAVEITTNLSWLPVTPTTPETIAPGFTMINNAEAVQQTFQRLQKEAQNPPLR